jgi:dGTPase
MSIRSTIEEREDSWLSPTGARSRGATRVRDEEPSDLRTAFQRDRDRIIHSKAFRRLKFKTQVFLSPDGDHYRTRLTHTLEVTQIARTIARALSLNEDLTEAIGLGHDLGHTPFGHAGERALARVFPGFRHNEQSLRVVDLLEKDGLGLNLTNLTRDGILRHSKPDSSLSGEIKGTPQSAEAQVVKISDSVAYMNHDFDDALRGGILEDNDLPLLVRERLGISHSSRIDRLVRDIVQASEVHMGSPVQGQQVIFMSPHVLEAADQFRGMLFERVYRPVNDLPSTRRAGKIVEDLFWFFVSHPAEMQKSRDRVATSDTIERQAADVVAGMTDRFALAFHSEYVDPS